MVKSYCKTFLRWSAIKAVGPCNPCAESFLKRKQPAWGRRKIQNQKKYPYFLKMYIVQYIDPAKRFFMTKLLISKYFSQLVPITWPRQSLFAEILRPILKNKRQNAASGRPKFLRLEDKRFFGRQNADSSRYKVLYLSEVGTAFEQC